MSMVHLVPVPGPADRADRLVDRVISDLAAGLAEPATLRLLTAAADGDLVLLRALVRAGLSMRELACRDGRWQWGLTTSPTGPLANLLPGRAAHLTEVQRAALRALTRRWAQPYAVAAGSRAEPVAAPAGVLALTPREREILVLLSDGMTSQAIARRLSLSPRTVAKHQERMYRKFGTSDRLTTVLRAQRYGLLEPPPAGH